MKVSSLEKENFELRGQLTNKLLIKKQLKADSKSNLFPNDISTTTNTITKPAQTNDDISSNNNNKNNNNNNCKNKNNDNNIKRTTTALMKKQFTTKSYKYNWWKFDRKNI